MWHAMLRATVSIKCGNRLKFDEIVARNVAQVESEFTSVILRALLRATISMVATRCKLAMLHRVSSPCKFD